MAVELFGLDRNLTVRGDGTSRTITLGRQDVASNEDVVLIDVPLAGVNTSDPKSLFDIRGDAGAAGILTLSTAETTVVDGDELGRINFVAPDEASGSDAILTAAAIWAEANDTFAAGVNSTRLVFATGTSEAATEKATILEDGKVGIGASAPAELLEIEDDAATTCLQISNSATDGDPYLAFALSGTKVFSFGVDDGDGDKFKLGTTAIDTNTRLTIDSSGNVGIGTASPQTVLHVDGGDITEIRMEHDDTATGYSAFRFSDAQNKWQMGVRADSFATASVQNAWFVYQLRDSADAGVNKYRMIVTDNGNVGVGLSDPAELLEIEDDAATTCLQISNSATDGDPYLAFALSGTKTFCMGVDDGDADKFKIGTTAIGTNTRLTIDSSGNVGFNNTDPKAQIHTKSGNGSDTLTIGTSSGSVNVSNSAGLYGLDIGVLSTGTCWLQSHRFDATATAYALQLNPGGGNVGVGVSEPAELLEIEDDAATTCLQISNTAADGDPYLAFALSGTKTFTRGVDDGDADKFKIGTTAIGTSTRITIDSTGQVGIGTSTPNELLEVAGDVRIDDGAAAGKLAVRESATAAYHEFRGAASGNLEIVAAGTTRAIEFHANTAHRGGVFATGDWGIGSGISAPSAGTFGKTIQFADNAGDPTQPTNQAAIYAKDVAGTVEMFAIDEGSSAAQLTPHNPVNKKWEPLMRDGNGPWYRVKMWRVVELLEELTGEQLIEIQE